MTTIAITVRPRVTFTLLVEGTAVGADGLSAYQIWLAEGNEGTEQDFLDSLEGAAAIVGHESDFDHTLIGTALQSETDPVVGAVNGIVKADGNGAISAAVAMTDYVVPFDIYNTNAWLQNHAYAIGDRFNTLEEGGSTAYYVVHTGFTSDATYNLTGKESLNCYAYFIQDADVANHELSYDHTLIGTALQSESDPLFSQWINDTPPAYLADIPDVSALLDETEHDNLDHRGLTGIIKTVKVVDTASYNVLSTDDILHVTYTATGAVSIDFKTAQMTEGREWVVKDAGFNAGTNNITITTEGAELIDNAATAVINSNGSAINIYCYGGNLYIY